MKAKDSQTGQFKNLYVKALDSLPVGASIEFAGTTIPDELRGTWMFERGQELSRTEYAKLFSVIGTSYGVGDGSTTFNLPNKCGKVPVGLDTNDTDFNTIGKTGGSKTDDLSNAYTKMVDDGNGKLYFNVSGGKNWTSTNYLSVSGSTSASQNSTYGINLGGSVSKVQSYTVTNYIIKVKETRPLASHTVNAYSESESNAYSCDYVNNSDSYSTSEVKTNKRWIGKPIYRKVIDFGALPNATEKTVNHNISNISFITNMYGMAYRSSDGQYINIPYTNVGSYNNARIIFKTTTIGITTANDMSGYASCYLVIEYTKTTD